jgi:hypothetical protein
MNGLRKQSAWRDAIPHIIKAKYVPVQLGKIIHTAENKKDTCELLSILLSVKLPSMQYFYDKYLT